jgi:hypothetical protein
MINFIFVLLEWVGGITILTGQFIFRQLGRFGRWFAMVGLPATLRWSARMLGQFVLWSTEQVGRGVEATVQGIARWLRRTLFGNWRRTGVTSVCVAFTAAHYFPGEVWPILLPLLHIAILVFAIRVMFHPFWSITGQRRRRRD